MAHITVPDQSPFIEFTVGAATSDFAFTFTYFDKTDIRIAVGGIELTQDDFEIVGTPGFEGGYPGGTLTLDAAVANTTVRFWSEMPPVRINDFNEGAGLPARAVNTELDRATARLRDMRLRMARTPTRTLALSAQLSVDDAGEVFTNEGWTATLTYTLPAASPGLSFVFAVTDAYTLAIVADSGDTIEDATATGDTLSSATVGSVVELLCAITGAWLVVATNGTWGLV